MESPDKKECPVDCVNRRQNGITLHFVGKTKILLDPIEFLVWLMISVALGVTVRDAWKDELTFRDSMERVAWISAIGAFTRLSPTDQLSSFLSNFYIGKK